MPDSIKVLFLGDIIGRPGRKALKRFLPEFFRKYSPSMVIANGENAAGGIGLTGKICREILGHVDVLTGGNHIWDKKEGISVIEEEPRVLRPANYPPENPGRGRLVFTSKDGQKIGLLNLQGRVFMEALDCPFRVAEKEVAKLREETTVIIVDFHAEATSEKQAIGWYLDGMVSAVIGTHTHVMTADERILPQGTAYITDAGMLGGYNTVIGIKKDQAIQRFITSRPQRFEPGKDGLSFSAVFISIDPETGKALEINKETVFEEENGGSEPD